MPDFFKEAARVTPRFRPVVGAIMAGALLAACATPSTREETGAAVGAIGGAAIGSQVGGGNGRTAAVIVGAVGGGVIGAKYGRYLDEQDKQHVTRATERALATGAPQVYAAGSGARVRVTSHPASNDNAPRMQAMVSREVDTSQTLYSDRRVVFAMTDMDLRAAPRLTSKTTYVFRRGERAEVVAYVPDSQYRLVSINGTAIGYAREVYLAARRDDLPASRHGSASNGKPVKHTSLSQHAAKARRVAVKGECRLVKRSIELPNGTSETETARYCKEPPAAWKQAA
jgi:uncharacterized protein YcfJ